MRTVKQRRWYLALPSPERELRDADEADRVAHAEVQRGARCMSVELRKGDAPRLWERVLYPALGLRVPETALALSTYRSGDWILVTFEEEESEWVAQPIDRGPVDEPGRFFTGAGEPFEHPLKECMDVDHALALVREFIRTGRRPQSIKWRKRE